MKNTNRPSITSIFIILSLMLQLFIFSSFRLYENKKNLIDTEFFLTINNGKDLFSDDELVLAPGEKRSTQLIITNEGKEEENYLLFLKNLKGELKDSVIFNIYLNDTLVYSKTASQFNEENAFLSEIPIMSEEKHIYTLEVCIKEEIGNVFENQVFEFDLVVRRNIVDIN